MSVCLLIDLQAFERFFSFARVSHLLQYQPLPHLLSACAYSCNPPFLAVENCFRFRGADLHPSRFTLSCRLAQQERTVRNRCGQEDHIISNKKTQNHQGPDSDPFPAWLEERRPGGVQSTQTPLRSAILGFVPQSLCVMSLFHSATQLKEEQEK